MKKNLVDRLHEKFATSSLSVSETTEDIERWKNYLKSLGKPKDCFDLSYNKYLCRMYYFSTPKKIFVNTLGFGAFFVELLCLLFSNRKLNAPRTGVAVLEKSRDVPEYDSIAPQALFMEFKNVEVIENHNEKFGLLCREARKYFLKNLKLHPFSFFYNYFVYMELVTHSKILLGNNPQTTIVYVNERNVASPIITELYHSQGRQLYSFMHGEYPLQLVCSFMRFSRYYIWDDTYIKMFAEDLNCKIDEYVVYTPLKLKKKWNLESEEPTYYCTYYFSGESDESVIKVAQELKRLNEIGKKCSVRPHPRNLLHKKLLEESFSGTNIPIENANEFPLKDSLARTKYVVGLQSTVLSEAYAEGKEIVLDDISDKKHFEMLRAQQFNVYNKPHLLFSELIERAND